MAEPIGFIKCSERHCNEIAEVRQAGGKRKALYTVCPSCGTNQGHGAARQKHLADNLKASREELTVPADNLIDGYKSDTEEKAAIPSKQAALSVSADTEPKPKPDTENKPKGSTVAPPVLLGVLALAGALITAFFATRKPQKEQTA
ncbi:hypothetical protein [Terasakiella pusilla]|uniref:hypothetical protein n=1 Tax=Terasakiella pusilla TaxID=64973 RepID=UPI003AA906E5